VVVQAGLLAERRGEADVETEEVSKEARIVAVDRV